MKKFMYFSFLVLVSSFFTGCVAAIGAGIIGYFAILCIGIIIVLAIVIPIVLIRQKKDKERFEQAKINVAKLKETPLNEFLKQNGFEQYSNIFKENKIETVGNALDLTDADLLNIGISTLTDRKKILSVLAETLTSAEGPKKRCPHCGSTNFQFVSVGGTGSNKCNDCQRPFTFPKLS